MENKEIKNTKPAVMSVECADGVTREKSEDGQFALKNAPKASSSSKLNSGDELNQLIDQNFSVPFFQTYLRPAALSTFYPGEDADIVPGTEQEDRNRGIDLKIVVNGNVEETFDLKTVTSAFGKDIYDEETPFAVNLYKTTNKGRDWVEGSHLNKHHTNTGYAFVFIDVFQDEKEIGKMIQSGKTLRDIPDVYGAKAFFISKEDFDKYINDRILSQNHVQNVIKYQKQYLGYHIDDFPEDLFPKGTKTKTDKKGYVKSISYKIPIPGEVGISANIIAYEQDGGEYAVRIFLPNKIFQQTSLKDVTEFLDIADIQR